MGLVFNLCESVIATPLQTINARKKSASQSTAGNSEASRIGIHTEQVWVPKMGPDFLVSTPTEFFFSIPGLSYCSGTHGPRIKWWVQISSNVIGMGQNKSCPQSPFCRSLTDSKFLSPALPCAKSYQSLFIVIEYGNGPFVSTCPHRPTLSHLHLSHLLHCFSKPVLFM